MIRTASEWHPLSRLPRQREKLSLDKFNVHHLLNTGLQLYQDSNSGLDNIGHEFVTMITRLQLPFSF
ncbi:hypothetical protein TNCV_1792201 [Trichonephila clavipes]|nr:hypothetical protein TNCV_1792201 [Trichonephila clavipes]